MAAIFGFIVLIALITMVKLGVRRLFRGKAPVVEGRRTKTPADSRRSR